MTWCPPKEDGGESNFELGGTYIFIDFICAKASGNTL